MKTLLALRDRLEGLQRQRWVRVLLTVVALGTCGAFFVPLISASARYERDVIAVMDALTGDDARLVVETLRETGSLQVRGRSRALPAPDLARVFDARGRLVDPLAATAMLLREDIPGWAPRWLFQSPGTTRVLGVVVLGWLLLIIWMRLLSGFLGTLVIMGGPVLACWLLGFEDGVFAFAGIGLLTFTFLLLTKALAYLLQVPHRTAAVALAVVREASRTRLALVFIVLLLVLLPLLPLGLDPASPLRYQVQTFLSRSLGLTFVVAACLTLCLSCATVAFEIRDRQIWQLMTKPLGRMQYLVGKWLGITLLNAIILVIGGISIFTYIQYLRAQPVVAGIEGERDRLAVVEEVLTARDSTLPDYVHLEPEQLDARVEFVVRNDPDLAMLEGDVPLALRRSIRREIEQAWDTSQRVIPPMQDGQPFGQAYRFTGLREAKRIGSPLTLRYKFYIGFADEHESYTVGFVFNDDPATRQVQTYVPTMTHRLLVSPALISEDGSLEVSIYNLHEPVPGGGRGSIAFDHDELRLLYRVGGVEGNFLRAMLLTLVKLGFLAALGIGCATFLSFPVAFLASFTIFAAGSIGPYLASSLEYYVPPEVSTLDWTDAGAVIAWVFQSLVRAIATGMVSALRAFGEHAPSRNLVDGLVIPWRSVVGGVLQLGLAWSGAALGVGWLVLRRRQLAIYSGRG